MRRIPLRSSLVACSLVTAMVVAPAAGQVAGLPKISERQFVSGSATLAVRGAVQIDAVIELNIVASLSDGGMTWLQFGDSGSAAPNVGVTVSPYEVGVSVGRGRFIATGGLIPGEASECTGKAEVTTSLVTGQYRCTGVTSYDPGGSGSGKVTIEISFTARS
jgi:hypothetical protein